MNGLDALIGLRHAAPNIPIIVVSSMADNRKISTVMQAGATGFVPKHSQRDVFRTTFETVALGQKILPEGFVEISEPATDREDALARLSTLINKKSRIRN